MLADGRGRLAREENKTEAEASRQEQGARDAALRRERLGNMSVPGANLEHPPAHWQGAKSELRMRSMRLWGGPPPCDPRDPPHAKDVLS